MHSDYTPITILLRLQNKIIDFTDFQVPIRSNRLSCHFGLAIGSTESAILKK